MFRVLLLSFIAESFLFVPSVGGEYLIFYNFPGFENTLSTDMDSDGTVGDAIKEIFKERDVQNTNGFRMSFGGSVLLDGTYLADAGIGAGAVVQILTPISPAQQLLDAFADTNFREVIRLSEDADAQNCSSWKRGPVTCDRFGIPTEISIWPSHGIIGSVQLSLLPNTIRKIEFRDSAITGTVYFDSLPNDLRQFILVNSSFTANLSNMRRYQWPAYLEEIYFRRISSFYGFLDCSNLPRSLELLGLDRMENLNHIIFHELPPYLKKINLNNNNFNELDLSKPLPDSLQMISILNTEINGVIRLQGTRNCTSLQFCASELMSVRLAEAAVESLVSDHMISIYGC